MLISDVAVRTRLPMPESAAQDAQARLKELVTFCAPRNPVDATAQVGNDISLLGTFTESLVRDGGYTSVLGFFTMVASSRRWPLMREQLDMVRAKYPDRLYVLSLIAQAERIRELEADGWICHEDPTRAVVAIDVMGRLGANLPAAPPPMPAPQVHPVTLPDTTPTEADAKRLLAFAGIMSAPDQVCAGAEQEVAAAKYSASWW